MCPDTLSSPASKSRRYEAVLRISEAISACRDPQELATILADQLSDFLSFDHLDVVIFKEKSTEIEWHAWGKGPLPFPDLPSRRTAGMACLQQPGTAPHHGTGAAMNVFRG